MAVDQNVNADEELLLPVSKDDESSDRHNLIRLGASFFLFGLINNVLYVVILSAALDLVPPATPKGIIAFCNIAPALLAKILWPYLLKGRIRYTRRIIGCCVLSVTGMVFVAAFEGLGHRLFGICLASLSSGLGELTFLQLSTTYPVAASGHAVGYFASGTGGAGVAGAALWWEVRGLGVTKGVAVSAFLPFVTPLTYFFLLPASAMFQGTLAPSSAYTAIPTADPNDASDEEADQTQRTPNSPVETHHRKRLKVSLTPSDKLRLVKPLFWRFMFPLFCVYTIEYTINQGIAPTLIFPVPDRSTHWLLSTFIKSLRDYYPLWQIQLVRILGNNHEL
ncbi:battenin CLN3 protein [Tulasnella sp. 419]|nr:battenin CLN3 protein [Tulasnella sp. 419]